jgi:hypothetical protein
MRDLRRWLVALAGTLLLLVAVSAVVTAAPLSGGTTLYIINGEDRTFTFDPIVQRDGLLLPEQVLEALQIRSEIEGRSVILSRGEVRAEVTLGSAFGTVNGEVMYVPPGPLRVVGRLFVPAALVQEFGFEVQAEGGLVQIRDLALGVPAPAKLSPAEYEEQWRRLSLSGRVRSDEGQPYMEVEFTLLTPELVASEQFPATYRQKIEYLNLLQTYSLALITVTNRSLKAGTLSPGSLMLVDLASGQQYDPLELRSYRGRIDQRIATDARKSSVLLYPKLPAGPAKLRLFADTNEGPLGTISLE